MARESQVLGAPLPLHQVTMDPVAFDAAMRGQGIQLRHFSAMRCPGGLVDINDIRRPHEDHADCSLGFLYTDEGLVTTLLTSNSAKTETNDIGLLNGSTITASFPRFYDDPATKQVYVLNYDRFYLTDETILTAEWQLVRAHETRVDRLRFPARFVQHLVAADMTKYGPECYDLFGGHINWRPGKGPSPGTVYSVLYRYQPYWYVSQLIHEIRVAGTRDYVTGKPGVSRMPFSAHLTRENVYQNEENTGTDGTPRTQSGPADSGFGAR